jgi:hypothetical protein
MSLPPLRDVKKNEWKVVLERPLYIKGLWPYASLFVYLFFFLQYIYSYNHSFITFAEAHLHIFTAAGSVGGAEPPWGAAPRFELGPAEISTRANRDSNITSGLFVCQFVSRTWTVCKSLVLSFLSFSYFLKTIC